MEFASHPAIIETYTELAGMTIALPELDLEKGVQPFFDVMAKAHGYLSRMDTLYGKAVHARALIRKHLRDACSRRDEVKDQALESGASGHSSMGWSWEERAASARLGAIKESQEVRKWEDALEDLDALVLNIEARYRTLRSIRYTVDSVLTLTKVSLALGERGISDA